MSEAQAQFVQLRDRLLTFVRNPTRRRMVIAIDGRDGAGKSPTARCLSWHLQMPAIETDMYFVRDSRPIKYRYEDLSRVIHSRLDSDRPVIVEGIFVLKTLKKMNLVPDFHILVEATSFAGSCGLEAELDQYFDQYKPDERCDFKLRWDDNNVERKLPFQCA